MPLTALKSLYLSHMQVSDLAPLEGLIALQTLYLKGTPVPQDEIDALRSALPNLRIEQ